MLLCLEQTHLLHGLSARLTVGITDLAIPQLVQGLVDAILGVQEELSRQVSCLQGKDHILAMAATCCSRPYPTSCRFKGLGCVEYRDGHAEFQIRIIARLAQAAPHTRYHARVTKQTCYHPMSKQQLHGAILVALLGHSFLLMGWGCRHAFHSCMALTIYTRMFQPVS